jgi:hypothetical protein
MESSILPHACVGNVATETAVCHDRKDVTKERLHGHGQDRGGTCPRYMRCVFNHLQSFNSGSMSDT